MNRDEALTLLRAHKSTIMRRYGVVNLALFGSIVRNRATDNSDVDVLVSFDSPATSKRYFGVQFYIEDLLGRPVDLVTDKALRAEMRPYIEREMISEEQSEKRSWRLYLLDMIDFGEKVLTYTDGLEQDAFIAETLIYDAVLRNLELIGEAATHLPGTVREAHPEIQWRLIIATRNRLAHSYLGVDEDVIWDIIQTDIPNLLPALRNLLNTTSEDSADEETTNLNAH